MKMLMCVRNRVMPEAERSNLGFHRADRYADMDCLSKGDECKLPCRPLCWSELSASEQAVSVGRQRHFRRDHYPCRAQMTLSGQLLFGPPRPQMGDCSIATARDNESRKERVRGCLRDN
jgi:hypothetical protein